MSAERLDELAKRANRDGLGLLLGAYLAQVAHLFYRVQSISPLLDQLLRRGRRESFTAHFVALTLMCVLKFH